MREHWQDPDFRAKGLAALQSPEKRAKNADASRRVWQSPGYRERHLAAQLAAQTPELKLLKSDVMKQVWERPEFRAQGEEHLRRIARDPARIAKISASSRGRKYGPRSPETLANMRQAAQNRAPASPETNAQIAATMKRVWQDPEQIAHRTEVMKDKWADPEYREKVLAARGQGGDQCRKGHPFDEANTIIDKHGRRYCRTCHDAATRASWIRRHPDSVVRGPYRRKAKAQE
jgi:hypothetical protein